MELEPIGTAVKLSITHTTERDRSKLIVAVSGGWPKMELERVRGQNETYLENYRNTGSESVGN
jgi:hypothetical protein